MFYINLMVYSLENFVHLESSKGFYYITNYLESIEPS